MLTQLYANNAITTLASSLAPSDTSIQVVSAASFPNPGPNEYFKVTIDSGTAIEVIFVFAVAGDTFIECLRGQEGTMAQNFQPGTQIECRVTKGTLEQFARYQDRLGDISSVDDLEPPSDSDGNSYLCATTDDGGNPIVAFQRSNDTWRFVNYTTTILTGTAGAGSTTTKLAVIGADVSVQMPFSGKYLVQFTSGANKGLVRAVTGSDSSGISWVTALPAAPAGGDSFEVYQSTSSILTELRSVSSDGLVYAILFSE